MQSSSWKRVILAISKEMCYCSAHNTISPTCIYLYKYTLSLNYCAFVLNKVDKTGFSLKIEK